VNVNTAGNRCQNDGILSLSLSSSSSCFSSPEELKSKSKKKTQRKSHSRIDTRINTRINTNTHTHRSRSTSSMLHATSSDELKSNDIKMKKRRKRTTKLTKRTKSAKASTATTSAKASTAAAVTATAVTASASARKNSSPKRNKESIRGKKLEKEQASHENDNNNNNDNKIPIPPSLRGIERLSRAVAKASAERETPPNTNPNETFRNIQNHAKPQQSPLTNQKMDSTSVSSLTQLTQVIDSQLYANGPRGANRGDYPQLNGVVQNARDNMISLLGFNQIKGDWEKHSSKATYNVAVVFGKDLVRDQITVEYASRIRTLAKLFKNEPDFRPSLVCFCGGIADGNHVSNADAGYIFFRHMCEAQEIDLDGVGIYIDNASRNDEDTMYCVTEKVNSDYVPIWLDGSSDVNSLNQKVLNVHFTMISTEYHLCNINDVHHRSPQQSLLNAVEIMSESFKSTSTNPQHVIMKKNLNKSYYDTYQSSMSSSSSSSEHEYYNNNYVDDDHYYSNYGGGSTKSGNGMSMSPVSKGGVVNTSWSFQYATYPYIYAKEEAVVFLGKCYLLGEELMPLLVNMKGVVEQREFFQRDNYLMLTSIRRSLVDHIEEIHKPRPSIKADIIASQKNNVYPKNEKDGRDVISILESALLSLGRCVDLVKPAGLHIGSVTKDEWKRALRALEHSMDELRDHCDPDRPLRPSEWGKLIDDEEATLHF